MHRILITVLFCCINFASSLAPNTDVRKFEIVFDPPSVRGLPRGEVKDITFNITVSDGIQTEDFAKNFRLILDVRKNDREIVTIDSGHEFVFNLTKSVSLSSNFSISALFLGYANITLSLFDDDDETLVENFPDYRISVVRKVHEFDMIFGVIIVTFVTINYINMGCHLDFNIIKDTLKTPFGPAIGFVCQFTIMPIVSTQQNGSRSHFLVDPRPVRDLLEPGPQTNFELTLTHPDPISSWAFPRCPLAGGPMPISSTPLQVCNCTQFRIQ